MNTYRDKIIVEAESFDEFGGWVVDHQAMDVMGSPYLLAHGLGKPVEDAVKRIPFKQGGNYHIWVRTREWAAPWNDAVDVSRYDERESPGRFQLVINGRVLPTVFGNRNGEWHWQYGGTAAIEAGLVEIRLRDLTGFDGRCDAIVFDLDGEEPPNALEALTAFRKRWLGLPNEPRDKGTFDLVVAGGGIAGICAAVAAARLGLKVALVHNRPVVGGNNSSEIRVQLGGKVNMEPFPALGNLVNELDPQQKQNARPASEYKDHLKMDLVSNEPNISLFLNTHIQQVHMDGDRIQAVDGVDILTGVPCRFSGRLFADCTGDANLGYLAGADFRTGRESVAETGESHAPEIADNLTMGTSVMWYSVVDEAADCGFPETPWAVQFDDQSCQKARKGDWDWELGLGRDQIKEIEYIRDYGLRVVYGNWSFLKNKYTNKAEFNHRRLDWVAYIGGKRESRRLLGDVILQEQDIFGRRFFPDRCVTTTWSIDLHYPRTFPNFHGEPFRARCEKTKIEPYAIPYRCLYSRNIANLFMAGRNISVTHVALGTVRVMKTTGMMGEVVGMAAALCVKHRTTPRGVYADHLDEFRAALAEGVPSFGSATMLNTIAHQ
ncbi:FAD dependent oxidoreductase [Parapedobacter luteus]|uniref:FAD dependent oxidoreductase n=1 Tax=Parapedobacter luteus TaxID=623280 RepID=A0A1T5FM17_9SPHI|nr:FAD-dependent oxidoreductase [Parapedobacter luteus]SKB97146.1 FAD dependent oxidoreductase [Parapedobacter luteus]